MVKMNFVLNDNLDMKNEDLLMIDIYKMHIVNREESFFSSLDLVIMDHANFEGFQQRDNVHSIESIEGSSKRRMNESKTIE